MAEAENTGKIAPKTEGERRRERLAKALRANLRRRKPPKKPAEADGSAGKPRA